MGEKRCFWILNWWEQVDENKGSSDGERTFPFPSSFLTFFPCGGKIVLAADSPNLSSFCQGATQAEARAAWSSCSRFGGRLLSDGHGHGNCEVPYVYSKHGVRRFYFIIRLSLFQSMDSLEWLMSCMERKTEHQLQLLTNAHHKDMKRCPQVGWHRVASWGNFFLAKSENLARTSS